MCITMVHVSVAIATVYIHLSPKESPNICTLQSVNSLSVGNSARFDQVVGVFQIKCGQIEFLLPLA